MTTLEEELARVKRLNDDQAAELKRLREPKALALKVSEKGACSLYGLQRFPVTLYKEQWRRLFEHRETIEAFLVEKDGELKTKSE